MFWFLSTTAAAATPISPPLEEDGQELEEIVVYADLRHRSDQSTPTSTSIIDAGTISRRNATHLEEVLNTAANVNFSSGASRARFFQIRGIGERSQFVEPLNPSVGLIVDGIDMTGLGTVASLMDARQVEILRGPQGTLYGANALAGLINITTFDPTPDWEAEATVGMGNYNTLETRGKVNIPLAEGIGLRLAASHLQSDGFFVNEHLGRDDTQNRDETTLRGKLVWQLVPSFTARLTAFHAIAKNGYDAFNFDNNRTTLSDNPGHDDQNTTGAGLDLRWTSPKMIVEARSSLAVSDVAYGYDEDWTYEGYNPDGYSSTDDYLRDAITSSSEVRLLSGEDGALFGGHTDWIVGLYAYNKKVKLQRVYTYAEEDFESSNQISRMAAYGESTTRFDNPFSVTMGLRAEKNQITYTDNDGVAGTPGEWLWGGKLSASYALDSTTLYALASRGYKAGGFNATPSLPDDLRQFSTESLWNLELGTKATWRDGKSRAKLAAFYQLRDQVQTNGSYVLERDDGSSQFIDYTTNNEAGTNLGIEVETDIELMRYLRGYGSLGLLDAKVSSPDPEVDGRRQPHAPLYQTTLGVRFDVDTLYGGLEVEAKDAFFFSTRHDVKSKAYALLNAHAGVRVHEHLDVSLWGRNLTNREVYTRGFGSFGNNPANGYATEAYYQLGEPRVFGARITGRM